MANLLGLALLLACSPSALIDFAIPKWKADREVLIEDAYKWTYQATRGGEHSVPDKTSAEKWLDNEWRSLVQIKRDEPMWEPLCPGGEIGRFNLRPFQKRGGRQVNLLEGFLASSREYRSKPAIFLDAWQELGRRLKNRPVGNLTYQAWKSLDTKMKPKNYPAIHHSDSYRDARLPAYRILTRPEMQKLLRGLGRANRLLNLPVSPNIF